tara:strand:+ start:128 stop:550 length:423 start_codon:yes stop_codon:yes gene_type:complete
MKQFKGYIRLHENLKIDDKEINDMVKHAVYKIDPVKHGVLYKVSWYGNKQWNKLVIINASVLQQAWKDHKGNIEVLHDLGLIGEQRAYDIGKSMDRQIKDGIHAQHIHQYATINKARGSGLKSAVTKSMINGMYGSGLSR